MTSNLGIADPYVLPIIREGDNVFIMNYKPPPTDAMENVLEKLSLSYDSYRCPFNFLTEFSQWFEWHIRIKDKGQSTGEAIVAMLNDIERIKSCKLRKLQFHFTQSYPTIVDSRSLIKNIT